MIKYQMNDNKNNGNNKSMNKDQNGKVTNDNLNSIDEMNKSNIQNDVDDTENIDFVNTEDEDLIKNDENQFDIINSDDVLNSLKKLNSWNDLMNSVKNNERDIDHLLDISSPEDDISEPYDNKSRNFDEVSLKSVAIITENYDTYSPEINNFESDKEVMDNDSEYENDYKSKIIKIEECFSQEEELLKALEKENNELNGINDENIIEKVDGFINSNKYIENNIRKYNFINNDIEEYVKKTQKNWNKEEQSDVISENHLENDNIVLQYKEEKQRNNSHIIIEDKKKNKKNFENYLKDNNDVLRNLSDNSLNILNNVDYDKDNDDIVNETIIQDKKNLSKSDIKFSKENSNTLYRENTNKLTIENENSKNNSFDYSHNEDSIINKKKNTYDKSLYNSFDDSNDNININIFDNSKEGISEYTDNYSNSIVIKKEINNDYQDRRKDNNPNEKYIQCEVNKLIINNDNNNESNNNNFDNEGECNIAKEDETIVDDTKTDILKENIDYNMFIDNIEKNKNNDENKEILKNIINMRNNSSSRCNDIINDINNDDEDNEKGEEDGELEIIEVGSIFNINNKDDGKNNDDDKIYLIHNNIINKKNIKNKKIKEQKLFLENQYIILKILESQYKRKLSMNNLNNTEFLSNIKYINLSNADLPEIISIESYIPNIEGINISNNNITSIKFIENIKNLEYLKIDDNLVDKLKFGKKLNIKYLSCSTNNINNISVNNN
ncbi:hypothetical protein BCR36DRAFT_411145 [Piromyces finnis]|uniref:L domain-like protein n=1 Tax=Piromyces finnis TaxID=1754191 RepID=A0A1Y1VD92_9FUNG|nr:hypothetical protein BCR36DRAFT_411145 [Piromyces finnis]|eukprot:ORX53370.1 hypothetical protein BCR36DRAFT_411145 [Piromyces finnis]